MTPGTWHKPKTSAQIGDASVPLLEVLATGGVAGVASITVVFSPRSLYVRVLLACRIVFAMPVVFACVLCASAS